MYLCGNLTKLQSIISEYSKGKKYCKYTDASVTFYERIYFPSSPLPITLKVAMFHSPTLSDYLLLQCCLVWF